MLKKLAELLLDGKDDKEEIEESNSGIDRFKGNKKGKLHEAIRSLAESMAGGEDDEEEDGEEVEMPKEEFVKEHEGLVKKLRNQDSGELSREADKQEAELEDAEDEDEEEEPKKKGGHAVIIAIKKLASKGGD